jgi:UDP:flavonoid glycosyltransferase YjiC (YdhE family)
MGRSGSATRSCPSDVRILFTFAGGAGHVEPLIPIAGAAKQAGHTVAITGKPSIVAEVGGRGFSVFATGSDGTSPGSRTSLLPLDAEREDRVLRDGFAGHVARRRVADVAELGADWRPDVIVCDEVDFGGMLAAERLGVPHATVLVIAAGSFVRASVVAEPLDQLRTELELPADPEFELPGRHLVLSPFPPSFREPAFPLPVTAQSICLATPDSRGDIWPVHRPGAPTVYATLGTVFNLESGDLFERLLMGLGGMDANVVATVGRQIDPAELGEVPANVQLERYLPQALVLPQCDVVVSHGGSGSVLAALTHGLPMVLLPMGADQPLNAARCEELGIARVIDAHDAAPTAIRKATESVLADPGYRLRAARFRDELAALPGPVEAVALLEGLGPLR